MPHTEHRPGIAFHCQAPGCEITLWVSAARGRAAARELGWSVASDDVGSQSVCPIHRGGFGR